MVHIWSVVRTVLLHDLKRDLGAFTQNELNWKHRAGLPTGRTDWAFAFCDLFLSVISDSPYF